MIKRQDKNLKILEYDEKFQMATVTFIKFCSV